MGLARILSYSLGLSAFLLSVALFHVGGSTGVQLFCLIGIGTFLTLKGAAPLRFLIWFCGLCLLIATTFVLQLQYGGDTSVPLKALVSFTLNLMVVWLGASFVSEGGATNWPIYMRGYLMGAMLSSILAILQFGAWSILQMPTSALFGIHNNRSFSDITLLGAEVFASGRGFAMTAEPALLALLLLPAAIVLWLRRRYMFFAVIACGMYATQSLTAVACLTAFIVLRFMFGENASGLAKKLIGISIGLISTTLIVAILMGSFASDVQNATNSGLQARVLNSASDPSVLSRMNSLVSGFIAVGEHPLIGWGMQSDELKQFLVSRSTIFEENAGINSLALSLTAWFGIPVVFYFLMVPMQFWWFTKVDVETKSFVLASIIPPLLTLGYYNVYSVWLCIGLAGGWVFAKVKINGKEKNAN